MEFEFSLVVDGISVDDELALNSLYEKYDAILLSHQGRTVLVVSYEGPNSIVAAHELLNALKRDLPQISVLRLDADLVGVSDIATRAGRTRQNVDQWIRGTRHGNSVAPFPAAEGIVGRSLVWRWSEVNEWLEGQGLGDGVKRPNRDESFMIDLVISQTLQTLRGGGLAIEVVAKQDDRFSDRMVAMNLLGEAIQDAQFLESLQTLPRKNSHRLKVVCSVLLDPLSEVVEQLGEGELSGALAAISTEGALHLTPIAVTRLPGTVSVREMGLGKDATVGDLILLQVNGRLDQGTPLSLEFA
ncbi:helix-turn-helix transcriptional regulator [Streptomyces bauhiniae]|uniref:helix-turn-helix transcriptional regulator n=1 Tax=Streptomyces bauhiniae TaxID=2340725 RepID=UPI0036344DA8